MLKIVLQKCKNQRNGKLKLPNSVLSDRSRLLTVFSSVSRLRWTLMIPVKLMTMISSEGQWWFQSRWLSFKTITDDTDQVDNKDKDGQLPIELNMEPVRFHIVFIIMIIINHNNHHRSPNISIIESFQGAPGLPEQNSRDHQFLLTGRLSLVLSWAIVPSILV